MKTEIKELLDSVDFGKEVFNDYYGEDNQKGYAVDKKRFNQARRQCINLLERLESISEAEMIDACKKAFSGRLEWNGKGRKMTYTAGQFYDIEVPQAISAVLEYIIDNKN